MHYYGQCDVESGRRDAECRFLVHREYNGRRRLISRCETTRRGPFGTQRDNGTLGKYIRVRPDDVDHIARSQ